MTVLLGIFNQDHGTVEASPSGLVYAGPDPEKVSGIVEGYREWYDRAGVKPMLADAELVRSLPYRMQGWSWAVFVHKATGLTQDQPAYDPWSELWRKEKPGNPLRATGHHPCLPRLTAPCHSLPRHSLPNLA